MSNELLIQKNLILLSARDSNLATRVGGVRVSERVSFVRSGRGELIPVVASGERSIPLHSRIDPEREGRRFASQYREDGYVIFLGLGGGYHIEPFLEMTGINGILIVERDLETFKAFLGCRALTKIISDPRVRIIVAEEPEEVGRFVLANCFPALFGSIQLIPLRNHIEFSGDDYFTETFRVIKGCLEEMADDFTVQSRYGSRWFNNTLSNLELAESSNFLIPPVKEVVITAAGPSLEDSIEVLGKQGGDKFIIATDTSLPVLKHYGVRPDLVISIDCQHITHLHFISGMDPSIPLVLDLASPPQLGRLTEHPVFFTSGHPLSQFINQRWRAFPELDTSGGNVAYTALSLAARLGAERVILLGVDYCYPNGRSYSRESYVHTFFQKNSLRLDSLERLFYEFTHFRHNPVGEKHPLGTLFRTRVMDNYRRKLITFVEKLGMVVENRSPYWEIPSVPSSECRRATPILFAAGIPKCGWREFLEDYIDALERMPTPTAPVGEYMSTLNNEARTLWLTLFPLLARSRIGSGAELPADKQLDRVKNWALTAARRYCK